MCIRDRAEVVESHGSEEATRAVVRAGALAPGYQSSHPDSAASRAAALLRKSETITPDHNRAKTQDADAPDDEEGHTSQPSSVWPWVVATLVLLLVLAVAGLMWAQSRDLDEYALKVEDSGEFVVQHTTRDNVFAEAETEDIQHACLSESGDLRVIAKDSTPGDCHVFSAEDLPDDKREVEAVTGSYDDVLAKLNELADQALPGCVDKQTPDNDTCREVR